MTATIQNQTWGFELEYYGLTRRKSAEVIQSIVGGHVSSFGRAYQVRANDGRTWKIVYDGSIRNTRGEQCELVTPVMKYEDIETLQEVIRELRANGAGVNDSCGIHVHVGADNHNAKSLRNLVRTMYSKQDMLYKAIDMHDSRANKWARKINDSLLKRFDKKMESLNQIGYAWYNGDPARHQSKYDNSRYHGLNLHSTFFGSTVEFRLFNATTHAGRAKAYIQFCLAVSAQAINANSASKKVTESCNEKYTFRTWLLRLGLNGEEFKTCRHHMLSKLEGDIAWRNQEGA